MTRASITAAALAVLAAEGFAAMTFARVAERAGVSRGAVLHYFPRKGDLVVAAIEDGVAAAMRTLRDVATRASGPDRDGQVLDAVYGIFRDELYRGFLAAQVEARDDAVLHERLAGIVAATNLEIAAITLAAWDLPTDEDTETLVRLVTATVRGLALLDPPGTRHDDATWALARRSFARAIGERRGRRSDRPDA